jgi:WD40 repeat protein
MCIWSHKNNEDEWTEEVNSMRINDDTIKCLKWSPNGAYVAILYSDGQVILGSFEGKQIWNRQLSSSKEKLTCLEVYKYNDRYNDT